MTATALAPDRIPNTASPAGAGARRAAPGVSFVGLLHSEWIKLRSLRSTWWTLGLMVLVSAGIGFAFAMAGDAADAELPLEVQREAFLTLLVVSASVAQLIAAVLGVLVISGEFGTGMIRSTMAADPRRIPVYLAKLIVVAAVVFAVGVVSSVAAYAAAAPVLIDKGVTVSLLDPVVLGAVLRVALYLVVITAFAYGAGAILRSTAGAISLVLGILLVLGTVLQLIPADWSAEVSKYLMTYAGGDMMFLTAGLTDAEIWRTAGVLVGWPLVSIALGGVLLARRDV